MDDATGAQSAYYGQLPDAGYEATDSDFVDSGQFPSLDNKLAAALTAAESSRASNSSAKS